jgi:hypothetical protein
MERELPPGVDLEALLSLLTTVGRSQADPTARAVAQFRFLRLLYCPEER